MASEKLYRNALKPTYLRNRSILRIFQPGYRLVRMNLHTLWQRYRSELYQGILHLLHKLGFLEKWCIGLDWQELHWVGSATVKTKIQRLSWKYTMLSLKFDAVTGEMRRMSIEWKIGISVKCRILVQASKLIKRSSV